MIICIQKNNILGRLLLWLFFFSQIFSSVLSYAQVPQNNIVVDNAVGQAPHFQKSANGTDVLNIVAPSQKGVSHNKFTEYNVNEKNLIINNFRFNNGTGLAQGESSLGGTVAYNHNLGLGNSARVILNEVTSNSTSTLKGYTEVFGDKAALIIANPNGITCEGCGFINTTRLSMVTGKANMLDGDIKNFSISSVGIIKINGVGEQNFGLHVDQAPAEIVSNMVKIAGLVLLDSDKELSILTGNDKFDYKNNKVTSNNIHQVEVAVDSTALGGMRAGNIRIHATQKGFGVNTDGALVADMDKVEMTAEGDIVYKNIAAKNKVSLTSEGGGITSGSTYASKSIKIEAKTDVSANGEYVYSKEVDIKAGGDIANFGQIAADNKINLSSTGKTTNKGEILSYGSLSMVAQDNLVNENSILAIEKIALSSEKDFSNTGEISASDSISIAAKNFINSNEIMTSKTLDITSSAAFENNGDLLALDFLSISAAGSVANSGEISSAGNIEIETQKTFSNTGSVLSSAILKIRSILGFTNNKDLLSNGDIDLHSGSELSNLGKIGAGSNISMDIGQNFNNSGEIMSSKELSASIGNDLINTGELIAIEEIRFLIARDLQNNTGGEIASAGGLNISAQRDILNKSGLFSSHDSVLSSGRNFTNEADISLGGVSLISSVDNILNKGEISSSGELFLETNADIVNQSKINANLYLGLKGRDIHNYGQIASNGNMGIQSSRDFINYRDSAALAGGDISFKIARNLINYMAEIFAMGNIDIYGTGAGKSAVDTNKVYDNPFVADTRTYDPKGNSSQDASVGEYEEADEPIQIHLTEIDKVLTIPLDAFGEGSTVGDTYNIDGYILTWGGDIDNLLVTSVDDEVFAYTIIGLEESDGEDIDTSGNPDEKESGKLSDYANSSTFTPLANAINALVNKGGRIESYGNIGINSDKLYNLGVNYNLGKDGYTTSYRKIRDEACYNCGTQELGRYYISGVNFNSIAGLILAGGDMNISSREILNQSSTLSAKNNLNIKTDSLTNKTSSYLVDLVVQLQARKKSKNSTGRVSKKTWNATTIYQERVYSKSSAIITAGNNLRIDATGGRVNNDQEDDATGKFFFGQEQNPNLSHQNKDVVVGAQNIEHGVISVQIRLPQGTNGLFVVSHDPRYLVVSNASFLNVNDFLGSPYFFDRITKSSNEYNFAKIIGDPIYETRLVMDAIRQATAGHYLSSEGNISSDLEQMKALYNSAIEQSDTLKLKVGIALSKEQIAALTNDIIWYVEKEVNGEKVLVPELYLSQATRTQIAQGGSGAKMTGGNVAITAESISNSGDIFAKNELFLKADYLNNESSWSKNARIIGDKTLIEADLLRNSGGSIGGRITQIAADTLINETQVYSEELRMGKNYELSQKAGYTGTIFGDEGVKIDVGNTLLNRGANIESAKGDVNIKAGTAIFDTVELHNRSEQTTKSSGFLSKKSTTTITDSVKNIGSTIAAGGNVALKTQQDATFRGSTVAAGESALFDIGGNMNIIAAKDSQYSYSKTKKSSLGGMKKSLDIVEDERQYLSGSNISTVDGLTVVSGKDTNIIGSNLSTGGDAGIYTGYKLGEDGKLEKSGDSGSLNILNDYVTNTHFEKHEKTDMTNMITAGVLFATGLYTMYPTGLDYDQGNLSVGYDLGKQSKTEISSSETISVSSNINIGGNLSVGSTENINIKGSNILSGGDIDLSAAKDINIISSADTMKSQSTIEKSKIRGVAGGGNSYVDAVYVADDLIKAVEERNKASDNLKRVEQLHKEGKASQSAVDDAKNNLYSADANIANASLNMAMAGSNIPTSFGTGFYVSAGLEYETTTNKQMAESSSHIGSMLFADGGLSFNAGNNMNQVGSIVLSQNGNIDYNITKDLNLLAGKDTFASSSTSNSNTYKATLSNNVGESAANNNKDNNGGLFGAVGAGDASSRNLSTTHTNSGSFADNGNINYNVGENMTADGYNAYAKDIDIKVGGDMSLSSKQNEAYGKNSSSQFGIGAGIGNDKKLNAGSLSVGSGKGSLDRQWVDNQTSIIGGESVKADVGGTLGLTGAMIANIDKDGVDQGNLDIKAGSLKFEDIYNYEYGSQSGSRFAENVGPNTLGKNDGMPDGSTSFGFTDKAYQKEGITHATIGKGTIEIGDGSDISGLNRDVNKAQEITKDIITGALDNNTTINNALLFPGGWSSINDILLDTFETTDGKIMPSGTEEPRMGKDVYQVDEDTGKPEFDANGNRTLANDYAEYLAKNSSYTDNDGNRVEYSPEQVKSMSPDELKQLKGYGSVTSTFDDNPIFGFMYKNFPMMQPSTDKHDKQMSGIDKDVSKIEKDFIKAVTIPGSFGSTIIQSIILQLYTPKKGQ